MDDVNRTRIEPEELSPEEAARRDAEEAQRLPALFRALDSVFKVVLAAMLSVLVFTVGANVVGRFVFNSSLAWADELSRFVFIWVIFLGAALAYFRDEHISVNILEEKLPEKAAYALNLVRDLLVMTVIVVFLWGSLGSLASFADSSAILGVPMRLVNGSFPVAAALMGLMCLYKIGRDVRLLAGRES